MADSTPAPKRVRIFIDFYNGIFRMRETSHPRIPYHHFRPKKLEEYILKQLGPNHTAVQTLCVTGTCAPRGQEPRYDALYEHMDYLRSEGWDARVLYRSLKVRQPSKRCPKCQTAFRTNDLSEKGVDMEIGMSMLEGALKDEFDIAVLISDDSDFWGICDRIRATGKSVVIARWSFSGNGRSKIQKSHAEHADLLIDLYAGLRDFIPEEGIRSTLWSNRVPRVTYLTANQVLILRMINHLTNRQTAPTVMLDKFLHAASLAHYGIDHTALGDDLDTLSSRGYISAKIPGMSKVLDKTRTAQLRLAPVEPEPN